MIQFPKRLQSIDVFRAMTMFFMIFVNDVDGVAKIPEWIKHVGEHTDGLGFADTIFPSFLFIVGLSIPFALSKRIQSGENKLVIAKHISMRALALIVMGFFHVNLENYSSTALLPEPVFEIIITLAFFLIWLDYKPQTSTVTKNILQLTGVLVLIVMAFLYHGEHNRQVVGMRHQWWGILGLIGWGYLLCALIFLVTKGRFLWQVIALAFFLLFNILSHAGMLDFLKDIEPYVWITSNASVQSFMMAGVVISLFYSNSIQSKYKGFFGWMILLAAIAITFGFLTRPVAGISKINDTPAWVGICTGVSIAVFTAFIFLVDVKGKASFFKVIKPAGTSTLTCYLIPYILYPLFEVVHFNYPTVLNEGLGGILRSFVVAFVVIFITRYLEKIHLRLKL